MNASDLCDCRAERALGGDTHLWTVTVVEGGLQEALGGGFVFSRGQLCQT